jgi:hypothetical protein
MSVLPENQIVAPRDFYRRHLVSSFSCSRRFSQPVGTVAEQIVDRPEFGRLLAECAPGSLDCARRIGDMVAVLLDRVPALAGASAEKAGPCNPSTRQTGWGWWRDLVNYERSWFLQAATTQEPPPWNRPRRGVSALCMTFGWNMPQVVKRIQSAAPVSDELRNPVTLLFSRTRDGNVCVAEVGPAVEKVFRATNNMRSVEQIAAASELSLNETSQILESLTGAGAIVPAMSAEEMMRVIQARGK